MTDITKCKGNNCPLKNTCYRFTAPSDRYQSFFLEVPYKEGKCEQFWATEQHINKEGINE